MHHPSTQTETDRDLVFSAVLGAAGSRVATADDGQNPVHRPSQKRSAASSNFFLRRA